MLISLIFTIVHAARKDCTTHTTSYYQTNYRNIPSKFFLPSTAANSNEKCEVISNTEMRRRYNAGSNVEVEHIIDISNGPEELRDCNKNIRGNLILAVGEWNRAIGQLCWNDVAAEKRLVYGSQIFSSAYNSVKECCGHSDNSTTIMYVILAIILMVSIGATVYFVLRRVETVQKYDTTYVRVGMTDSEANDGFDGETLDDLDNNSFIYISCR